MPGATTQTFTVSLGPSKGGLLPTPGLTAQLRDIDGVVTGSAVTTGFVDLGGGNYSWTGSIPDKFRGSVSFAVVGGSSVLGVVPINPEEIDLITEIHSAVTYGSGGVLVDHNYGGTDALRYVSPDNQGIAFAEIKAFASSDYAAGNRSGAYVQGRTQTGSDGRWKTPLALSAGSYKLVFSLPGRYGPDVHSLTVT